MSKELVRFKYKSDIINCIEESWDYFGKEDEKRKVIKELRDVYKIASSAKNAPKHEYEAKAKAFDEIREARKEVLSDVRERGLKLPTDLDKFSMMTERIINKYESGGYDD